MKEITDLDFLKLKDKVRDFAYGFVKYKRELRKMVRNIENPSDTYIEEKIRDEFTKKYGDIYEQLFRLSERLDKLENNK